MVETLSSIFLLTGGFFMLLAGIGLYRMPDVYLCLHSNTKSATLGVGCLMLGAALHFGEAEIYARVSAIVVFFFATAPVAAHMIARAAYMSGVPLWEGTLEDALHGRYDRQTHTLSSTGDFAQSDSQGEDGIDE